VKFVLVNGRTPFRKDLCGLCSEPIGEGGYLRDIRTRLYYCGAECYALMKLRPPEDTSQKARARAFERGWPS
jgi:hypothetical protein